jgi:hypothetical protein
MSEIDGGGVNSVGPGSLSAFIIIRPGLLSGSAEEGRFGDGAGVSPPSRERVTRLITSCPHKLNHDQGANPYHSVIHIHAWTALIIIERDDGDGV